MRELTNLFAAIAKAKAEGCKCDNGAVWGCATCDNPDCDCGTSRTKKPCPTCAKLREMAEWCWHEWEYKYVNGCSLWMCSSCGKKKLVVLYDKSDMPTNPTFTVQSIREALEVLGEWEGFVKATCSPIQSECMKNMEECTCDQQFADILTSDPLMVEAAKAYLTQQLEEMR